MSFEAAPKRPRVMVENRRERHPVGGVRAERLKAFFAEIPDDAIVDVEITAQGKFLVARSTTRRTIKPSSDTDVNKIDEEE